MTPGTASVAKAKLALNISLNNHCDCCCVKLLREVKRYRLFFRKQRMQGLEALRP